MPGQDQIARQLRIEVAACIGRAIDFGITPERLVKTFEEVLEFEQKMLDNAKQNERSYA